MSTDEPRPVVVRLTEDAVDDLASLNRHNPPAVRWCLKKMLLLERSPRAGEPLLGDLIGFRKLTVGDRHWRIVWRITDHREGGVLIDVAEVWAAGARADSEVYAEMRQRVAKLGDDPRTQALAHVVEILGKAGRGLEPRPEPIAEPVPDWLASALTGKGVPVAEIARMTPEEAFVRWNALISRPHD